MQRPLVSPSATLSPASPHRIYVHVPKPHRVYVRVATPTGILVRVPKPHRIVIARQ